MLWRREDVSRPAYVLVGAAWSLGLSWTAMGAYWLVAVPVLGLTPSDSSSTLPHPLEMLLGWVLFAPLVETGFLAAVLFLAGRLIQRTALRVLVGALPFGLAHGFLGSTPFEVGGHAVVSVAGFLVFAVSFLAWRRVDVKHAFWMCAWVHMAHNLGVMVVAYADAIVRT